MLKILAKYPFGKMPIAPLAPTAGKSLVFGSSLLMTLLPGSVGAHGKELCEVSTRQDAEILAHSYRGMVHDDVVGVDLDDLIDVANVVMVEQRDLSMALGR